VTDTRPPGVSYRLTDAGSALKPILSELAGWASENLPERCPDGA
jgi:DNA-binding HxlR family transcriptional regulator